MRYPLHVAFVWHMHQPHYLDEAAGSSSCPGCGSTPSRTTSTWWRCWRTTRRPRHLQPGALPVEQLDSYVRGHGGGPGVAAEPARDAHRSRTRVYVDSLFFSVSRERIIKRVSPVLAAAADERRGGR